MVFENKDHFLVKIMCCTLYIHTIWKTLLEQLSGHHRVFSLYQAENREQQYFHWIFYETCSSCLNCHCRRVQKASTFVWKDQDSRRMIGQTETGSIHKDSSRNRKRSCSLLRYMKDTQRLCTAREVPRM